MKITKNILNRNWITIISVLLVGFFLVSLFLFIMGLSNAKKSSNKFADYYLQETKDRIKNEVDNRYEEIDFAREGTRIAEYNRLKETIQLLSLSLIQSGIMEEEDLVKRREQAVILYEKLVREEESRLYFALSPEGVLLKSGTDYSINGVNLIDAKDCEGTYYTREIVKAVEVPEGIYVDYYWPKEKDGRPLKKTSYCLYIPEIDLIIGAGIYHVDMEKEIQKRVYENLQNYYLHEENYVFVTSYDGISIVSSSPEVQGIGFSGFLDENGEKLHERILEEISDDGNGYITYRYYKKNEKNATEKISYVRAIDEWKVYMGMGAHTDDLNKVIKDYSKEFFGSHLIEILSVIVFLGLIAIWIVTLIRRGLNLQSKYLKQTETIFMNLIEESNNSIFIVGKNGEFKYCNKYSVDLFNITNVADYIQNDKAELVDEQKSIYRLENKYGGESYIERHVEEIIYEGEECSLYFDIDVTSPYLQSTEYEKLSLIDDLSGLMNRRALKVAFEDYYDMGSEHSMLVFALIDIDDFKIVNDQHGHDVGDKVIQILGRVFKQRLRSSDNIYRFGGEEFVVLMYRLSLEQSKEILMKINEKFSAKVKEELDFSCSFSGGAILVSKEENNFDYQEALVKADHLLYKAKENGKNRIEIV